MTMNKRDGWLKIGDEMYRMYLPILGMLEVGLEKKNGKWEYAYYGMGKCVTRSRPHFLTAEVAKYAAIRNLESRISRTVRKLVKSRRSSGENKNL